MILLRICPLLALTIADVWALNAFAQDWSAVHKNATSSILFVQTVKQNRDGTNKEVSTGTAFVVSERGYALTVAHLVPQASSEQIIIEYKVALGSRQAPLASVEVVKRDIELDLALLRLPNTSQWIPLPIGMSGSAPEGVPLYTLGFPRNSDLAGAAGVLSSTLGPGGRWQTTFPLEHGNSGSPIFDVGGRVVAIGSGGIEDAKLITYAVPADYARFLLSMIQMPVPLPTAKLFDFLLDITVDHEDAQEFAQEFCTPDGSNVKSWTYTIASRAGPGTRVLSIEPIVGRNQCVRVRMYVAGNGVDRIGVIVVNYRGRGWLTGQLHLTSE